MILIISLPHHLCRKKNRFVYTFITKDRKCNIKIHPQNAGISRYGMIHETHNATATVPV